MSDNRKTQIVVVGGGAGGLELVRKLGAKFGRTKHDIILIDRTLHMLYPTPRHALLARLLDHTARDGWVVIADESSNLPGLNAIAEAHARPWRVERQEKGLLLLQHVASG